MAAKHKPDSVEVPPDIHSHDVSTPHLGFASAGQLVARTHSTRSRVHQLTPAGHRTETKHLTEISVTRPGAVGMMAKQLAEIKHFSADVTNFIEEMQEEIQLEEQRLEEHLASRALAPSSPLSGPLFHQQQHSVGVLSTSPSGSPASSPKRLLDVAARVSPREGSTRR